MLGQDGIVRTAFRDAASWHWSVVPNAGFNQGNPIAAVRNGEELQIFELGQDGVVRTAFRDDAGWHWSAIDGAAFHQGNPIAAVAARSKRYVLQTGARVAHRGSGANRGRSNFTRYSSGMRREWIGTWTPAGGRASRIAVAPDGSPWAVTSAGQIFPSCRQFLAARPREWPRISALGAMALCGQPAATLEPVQDVPIFRLDPGGWTNIGGAALNISAGRSAQPFVVNAEGRVYSWRNSAWMEIGGRLATDIAVNARGATWITAENGDICFLGRDNSWTQVPGKGFRIAVGPDGNPWVVAFDRTIYRMVSHRTPAGGPRDEPSTFEQVPGRANDIGIGADGSIWVTGYSAASGPGPVRDPQHQPDPPKPKPRVPPQEITDITVRPELHKVTILFHTGQATSPQVEICKSRPEQNLTFRSREVLVIAPNGIQGTVHSRWMEGLASDTRYFFVITAWDGLGLKVKATGEFHTSIRFDE